MQHLKAIVLGSAAGGGFPQWNCCCSTCQLAWEGDRRVRPRTQASLAVSADGTRWVILNASPDLRTQVAATRILQPQGRVRNSPIEAVILTGAEVDQIGGLLHLRERQRLAIYGTPPTLRVVAQNSIFGVLAHDVVTQQAIGLEEHFLVAGIETELFAVPGKVPLYLEHQEQQSAVQMGDNVGIELRRGDARLLFMPSVAAVTPALRTRFAQAAIVLLDGTLFSDDEMIRIGTGTKTSRQMGHMPIDGPDGSLKALSGLSARRIYIHINNTNPILVEGSPERRQVEVAGIEVAEDGMEIVL